MRASELPGLSPLLTSLLVPVALAGALASTAGCGGPDCAAPEYGSCVRDFEAHGARDLAFISWLEGDWLATDTDGRTHAVRWAPATGGIMIGYARSSHGDRDLGSSVTRIEFRRESISYSVHEGGAVPGAAFELADRTLAAGGEARFENAEADFPTRIIFRRSGDDELLVRIENDDRGFTRVYERTGRDHDYHEEE